MNAARPSTHRLIAVVALILCSASVFGTDSHQGQNLALIERIRFETDRRDDDAVYFQLTAMNTAADQRARDPRFYWSEPEFRGNTVGTQGRDRYPEALSAAAGLTGFEDLSPTVVNLLSVLTPSGRFKKFAFAELQRWVVRQQDGSVSRDQRLTDQMVKARIVTRAIQNAQKDPRFAEVLDTLLRSRLGFPLEADHTRAPDFQLNQKLDDVLAAVESHLSDKHNTNSRDQQLGPEVLEAAAGDALPSSAPGKQFREADVSSYQDLQNVFGLASIIVGESSPDAAKMLASASETMAVIGPLYRGYTNNSIGVVGLISGFFSPGLDRFLSSAPTIPYLRAIHHEVTQLRRENESYYNSLRRLIAQGDARLSARLDTLQQDSAEILALARTIERQVSSLQNEMNVHVELERLQADRHFDALVELARTPCNGLDGAVGLGAARLDTKVLGCSEALVTVGTQLAQLRQLRPMPPFGPVEDRLVVREAADLRRESDYSDYLLHAPPSALVNVLALFNNNNTRTKPIKRHPSGLDGLAWAVAAKAFGDFTSYRLREINIPEGGFVDPSLWTDAATQYIWLFASYPGLAERTTAAETEKLIEEGKNLERGFYRRLAVGGAELALDGYEARLQEWQTQADQIARDQDVSTVDPKELLDTGSSRESRSAGAPPEGPADEDGPTGKRYKRLGDISLEFWSSLDRQQQATRLPCRDPRDRHRAFCGFEDKLPLVLRLAHRTGAAELYGHFEEIRFVDDANRTVDYLGYWRDRFGDYVSEAGRSPVSQADAGRSYSVSIAAVFSLHATIGREDFVLAENVRASARKKKSFLGYIGVDRDGNPRPPQAALVDAWFPNIFAWESSIHREIGDAFRKVSMENEQAEKAARSEMDRRRAALTSVVAALSQGIETEGDGPITPSQRADLAAATKALRAEYRLLVTYLWHSFGDRLFTFPGLARVSSLDPARSLTLWKPGADLPGIESLIHDMRSDLETADPGPPVQVLNALEGLRAVRSLQQGAQLAAAEPVEEPSLLQRLLDWLL